ncbi:hypothetical protein ACJIZ3_004895 [Penstemon smallii]|uniref:Oleosin n=1 Tax=Penstemon smallii TaxID=265156 RepID=A0ABD3S3B2_9LAMI
MKTLINSSQLTPSHSINMSDQPKPMSQKLQESTPTRSQAVILLTATTIGGFLLGLAGMTLTGTLIALIIATPVLLLVSPIVVPAAVVLASVTTGFLSSGGFLVAALAVVAWLYKYVARKHLFGASRLDYAKMKIASKARDVKERAAREHGHKTQEPVQGS